MGLSGNKGEWTELYVFARLLADGELYQADINLEKDENNCYHVVMAVREDSRGILEYNRAQAVDIYRVEQGQKTLVSSVDIETYSRKAQEIFEGIKKGKTRSFPIPDADDFIQENHITKLTALATSKSDLRLRIYDHRLAKETDLGFSIKSLMGKDSTLFNAGAGNNFIYQLEGQLSCSVSEFNESTYAAEGKLPKITVRANQLLEKGLQLKFRTTQSPQLWVNLKMVDGDLPDILAHALLYRYTDHTASVKEVVELLEQRDPLQYYSLNYRGQRLYEYKMKKFLAECAMGMTSETAWHGMYDATGGAIICKQDGEVLCFHIYDFNLFREYLLNNTRFEQPSTGEDASRPGNPRTDSKTKRFFFGWLYEESDNIFLKINLQIRFG